jgi:hypothetical protein
LDLNERFLKFFASIPGAEPIDKLTPMEIEIEGPRADFFLNSRQLVVEVKSAAKDMRERTHDALRPFTKDPDWPVVFGTVDVESILRTHPRAEQIRAAVFAAATTAVTDQFEKANRQIRNTKTAFNVSGSRGLMVYLNDKSAMVGPNEIKTCVDRLMSKRGGQGEIRHPDVDAVLIISETHVTAMRNQLGTPILAIMRPEMDMESVCNGIAESWAAFSRVPLIHARTPQDLASEYVSRHRIPPLESP